MSALIRKWGGCFYLVLCFTSRLSYAHDWPVHQAISASAYQASDGLQTFISENLETNANALLTASQPQIQGGLSVSNWLTMGSKMEDEQYYGSFPIKQVKESFGLTERSVDHFYTVQPQRTPGQMIGLTDWSEPPGIGHAFSTFTTNSFKWATDDNVLGPYGIGANVYKWDNARSYGIAALTNASQFARNTNMASMFYALGHVLHLNQDLTSPDHVRDANHFYTAYFEKYGDANYTKNQQWFALPQNRGWAYWQSQGFSQLLDFWDRGLYSNSSSFNLKQEAGGYAKLGLAEWSNGNFLGETALYNECYPSGDIHSFPFPSLFSSTSYPVNKDIASYLDSHLRTNFLSDGGVNPKGSLVPRVYIDKTGDGITFSNHSVLSYLGIAMASRSPFPRLAALPPAVNQVSVSIHDNNVLQAYHDRLIPKAIEYSAGILDYFFRGTMDISVSVDANTNYTFGITNTSSQDFSGGSFYLFEDDTNEIRTLAQPYSLSDIVSGGILSAGSSVNITYPGVSTPSGARFLIVYQGTIGQANGSALDPVDENIGIAAARQWVEQTMTYAYQIPVPDPYYVETITTNLESDDFGFPITSGNYEVMVNYAKFDDTGTIGSLTCQMSEFPSCTLPDEITNAIVPVGDITITPDGQHLSVSVTATDDPICQIDVGWWTITITWRAWPAQ
jgi:hypothetical protein